MFLICAVLIIVLFLRFKGSDEWSSSSLVPIEGLGKEMPKGNTAASSQSGPDTKAPHVDIENLAHEDDRPSFPPNQIVENVAQKPGERPVAELEAYATTGSTTAAATIPPENPFTRPYNTPAEMPKDYFAAIPEDDPYSETEDSSTLKLNDDDTADPTKTSPQVIIPDREPLSQGHLQTGDVIDDPLHPMGPGRKDPIAIAPSITPVHWKKQPEQFPVPTESLIRLPTGKPIEMRKIQFKFSDETPTQKTKREQRLGQVKKEFQKAWSGYKEFAWMHDELSPKSGKFRDPFCGWAATLVDSLDTLYIMGLEDDFAEAVAAVKNIDFTTCMRPDLQVFEITIRYLGGLIGAYDISGQKHKILLDKAVELGEILIGVFDTPNRMPILFYQWRPAFASQSHRASARSNLAELGSLTVEFTRLAQLTNESKYYDAVARITDALVDWQTRGTRLSGLFPDEVDASGCNFTVPTTEPVKTQVSDDSLGRPATIAGNARIQTLEVNDGRDDLELQIIPGQPAKGSVRNIEKEENGINPGAKAVKRDLGAGGHTPPPEAAPADNTGPAGSVAATSEAEADDTHASKTVPAAPLNKEHVFDGHVGPNSTAKLWDCVPQGLDSANSGYDHFSMGGSQDSTYEYFSKEYMLLGGQEDNYRTMYINTMDAVRKHLLYRPMIPGNADILFSGKVTTAGHVADIIFESEVTHLTCFLGGMVGMGAKLFDIESDIEIAKKLTEGCVWAYASMNAGVMAEASHVFPCRSISDCTWNETLWWQHLDPSWAQRDEMIKNYDEQKAKLDSQIESDRIANEARLLAEDSEQKQVVTTDSPGRTESSTGPASGLDTKNTSPLAKSDTNSPPPISPAVEDRAAPDAIGSMATPDKASEPVVALHKRQVDNGVPEAFRGDKTATPGLPKTPGTPGTPGTPEVHKTPEVPKAPETPQTPEVNMTPGFAKTESQRTQEVLDKKKQETEEELNLAATGREGKKSTGPLAPKPVAIDSEFDPNRPLNHTAYVKERIAVEGLKPGYLRINSDRYILR